MGYLKRPIIKPIKHLGRPVWYSTTNHHKIFMSFEKAKEYSLRTGKNIFMKLRR